MPPTPFLVPRAREHGTVSRKHSTRGASLGTHLGESINRKLRPLSVPFVPPIKMRHLNPVRKGFGRALARPTPRLGLGLGWAGLGWAGLGCAGLGWAALGWSQKRGPEPTLQDSETQRHGGPKRAKTDQNRCRLGAENATSESSIRKSPWQRFGKAHTKAWADLGCGGLGCTELMGWCGLAGLGWAGLGRAGLGWVTRGWHSESHNKKSLAEVWQGPHQGLG